MKNKMIAGASVLMITAAAALAQDNTSNVHDMNSDQGGLYRARELSLDAFGTASVGQYTIDHPSRSRVRRNTRLGVGAGFNYFFCKYIGIGGDGYSENTSGAFVDSAEGNLIARLPIGDSGLAPYIFGGGGHQFDLAKVSFGQFGGGIEYRFCKHVGAFVDARWVLPNETKNYGVGRAGLRYAF